MSTVKRALLFGLGIAGVVFTSPVDYPIRLETRTTLDTRIANIHIEVVTPLTNAVDVSYGDCDSLSSAGKHHDITKRVQVLRSSRLVWRVPEDSPSNGCLVALDSETGEFVAKSTVLNINLRSRRKRSFGPLLNERDGMSIQMNNASGIDSRGPWFDGVEYLEGRNVSQVDVGEAKNKSITSLQL